MNTDNNNPNGFAANRFNDGRGAYVHAVGDGAGSGNFTMNDTLGMLILGTTTILLIVVNLILVLSLRRQATARAKQDKV